MTARAPRSLAIFRILALLLTAGLAACGPMLVSERYGTEDTATNGLACRYQAGAYALPRDLLRLEFWKKQDQGAAEYIWPEAVSVVRTADTRRIYCLDFLSSILADDKIAIGRGVDSAAGDNSSLLLAAIGSQSTDRSLEIAHEVVKAAVHVASNRGGFLDGKTSKEVVEGQFDFDPFDRRQMDKINDALEPLRHCVFLDPTNDPYVPDWHGELCKGYVAHQSSRHDDDYYGLAIIDDKPPPVSASFRGVLYKPLLTHNLVIMQQSDNPDGPGWRVFETRRVQMTNAAPAFMLEINRSAFVTRKTDVKFDKGVLQSVTVDKPSEMLALSRFILSTTQLLISIPVSAVVPKKSEADSRKELIDTQDKIILNLRQYNAAVERQKLQEAENVAVANGQQPARAAVTRSTAVETAVDGSIEFDECLKLASARPNPRAACEEILANGGSYQ